MDDNVAQTDIGDDLLQVTRAPRGESHGFTEQVADYFGGYVDGSLTGSGLPLRMYGDTYDDGIVRKVSLDRYTQLSKNIYKNFVTGFGQQSFVITQNKYIAQRDERILDAVDTNVSKVAKKDLQPLLQALATQAEKYMLTPGASHQDDVAQLLHLSKQVLTDEFVVPVILPFTNLSNLPDKKIKQQLVIIKEAAVSRLYDDSKELLRQTYAAYVASESYVSRDSLVMTLADVFTLARVKDSLSSFLDHLYINDAYQHVYGLHRSTTIDERKNMYVYFGELKYESLVFPLFYVKATSRHTLPSITLTFENRIFVNKRAIEYVIRQFAARTNHHFVAKPLTIPKMVHSTEDMEALQRVVTQLAEALHLSDDIKIAKPTPQEISNHFATLTNKLYFYVDCSTGSAVADDYAVITQDQTLRKKTDSYFRSLLSKTPARYVEEITEAWAEKSYFDKLIPTIPLSLNDEQKQVLMALDKPLCERVVVDSAEATGKNHLVKAAVIAALAKNQSVLVVSANAAMADKIRSEIGETLTAASGKQGHNPVLNAHNADSLDSIDDQAVADISASVDLVESKSAELALAKKRKKQALKESLAQFVQGTENINLHEIEQTVSNERRFAGRNWIDNEPIETISEDMQHLHRAIQYLRTSEAGYLMPYVESEQRKAIEDFIDAYREYEKASRNVHARLPKFIVRYKKLLPEQKEHMQENLAYIQSNYRQFMKILKDQPASNWLDINDNSTFQQIAEQEIVFGKVLSIARDADEYFQSGDDRALLRELDAYDVEPHEIVEAFDTYIEQIGTLKSKLFGFSGRMLVVENLNKQLIKSLPSFSLPEPEKQVESMQLMSGFVRYVVEELAAAGLPTDYWKNVVRVLSTSDNKITEISQIITSLNQTTRFDFVLEFKVYEADNLLANITLLEYATELNRVYRDFPKLGKLFGVTALNHLLARPHEFSARISKLSRDLSEASQLNEAKQTVHDFIEAYPEASKRLGIVYNGNSFEIVDEMFAGSNSEYLKEYIAHKKKEQEMRTYFDEVSVDQFGNMSLEYQQILGVELQQVVNKNALAALKGNDAAVRNMGEALAGLRRLSVDDTRKLIQLFPIITGDVHRLSSLLPLVADLFDVVIIDQADSLAVADVIPSVLRAKKALIVGDSRQTISRIVNSAANDLYAGQLSATLRGELSSESADNKNGIIAKQAETFVANNSALAFFAAYANYDFVLKKQFGVYEELASFGNRYYYEGVPVSLNSRAVPLAELFKFSKVTPTADQATRFTNAAEATHIIQHLHTLKEQGFTGTIGIVTPFAEQAALIQKELDESVITDWFERRDLKVMTFDSRRGTPRDYMYYSLVASTTYNELPQKLPSAIGFSAFPGDNRSSRLLTGFSGDRHAMHIVHSLAPEAYGGSLSEALEHFNNRLTGPTVTVKGAATDVLLATEANIKQIFEQTSFAKKYSDRLSFVTKYPFANYIRPLSPKYQKASYKVYFLVMIDEQPIVIEYDDFKERFLQNSKDGGNTYLSAQDIYGYKLLEGYGYRFLRLNKFNIGDNPVDTLDQYLNELVRTPSWPLDNGFVA